MPVPVHVISGFLGTGKTTALLARLDAAGDERPAVIVNDFGDATIDAEVVGAGDGVALTEIRGACVCCTAPEGFTDALGAVLDTEPDRIWIEPTGLARPSDLIDTMLRGAHRDRIELRPLVVLVDPHALDDEAAERIPLLREQAEAADVLIANRCDLATEAELQRFRAWAARLWPGPFLVGETTFGALPDAALVWPSEPAHDRHHHHDHDHAPHDFTSRSWFWPADARFSRDRLGDALARLAAGRAGAPLARLKGLFQTEEGAWLIEVAGGQVHERPSGHRRDSRVDVIVHGTGDDALDQADTWLQAALLTGDERRPDPHRLEVVRPDGTRAVFDRAALAGLPDGVADISALIPKRAGVAARVRELLGRAGVAAGADVVVVAADGYATPPVPVEALHTAVLVHTLGDGPLPDDKGGPFRLLIPGDAGPGGPCANVKGVVKIALRTRS